ncbi:uncharacterized protein F5891DRAFT_1182848 [Suillus fuscotomentosus]|uniref:Uncharacterized protein n=1 Tax=Suillus fuscotomentosus TaxID=1912939 RepID=A0AAD4EGE7_9AGAM|nr:uncharacterized protein F5891DRAFT_1182848 [Suillus fuscotomentosus]KAG1905785.1 hypothetical protein F5891DRAFT_1182848 [Suillus fuscotomentosus]
MTSTINPSPIPLSPMRHEYPGASCANLSASNLVLGHEKTNFLAWRNNVSQQPQEAYPSPPTSHEAVLQELPPMDTLCLPPFWETRYDSDITIRLISARQSERRAESRLIRSRLRRVMIEQELYSSMDKRTAQRLHKANISLGIARGVLRSSGLTPAGNTYEGDSDASSVLHESDPESDLEPSS